MTAVRSVDSFKYGTRLFAYLFVILLVGGGLLGLGAVIIENANTSLSNGVTGIPDKTELAGGSVLALLGSFVLLSGLFGILYKLIADGVTLGQADAAIAAAAGTETATEDAADSAGDGPARTGPSPGEQAARDHGAGTIVPSGASSKPPATPQPPESASDTSTAVAEPTSPQPDPEPTPSRQSDVAEAADGTQHGPEESAASETAEAVSRPPAEPDRPDAEDGSEPTDSDQSATTEALDAEFGSDEVSSDTTDEQPSVPDEPEAGSADTLSSADDTGTVDETTGETEHAEGSRVDQPRPEPSPEEIAFGTTADDAKDDEPATDAGDEADASEPEGLASFDDLAEEDIEPAEDSSANDPLADPTDDE